MAKIIQDEEQMNALNTIAKKIDLLRTLDELLTSATAEPLVISRARSDGRAKRVDYTVDQQHNKRIASILSAERHRMVKEVRTLADKYHIQLDTEENELLAIN